VILLCWLRSCRRLWSVMLRIFCDVLRFMKFVKMALALGTWGVCVFLHFKFVVLLSFGFYLAILYFEMRIGSMAPRSPWYLQKSKTNHGIRSNVSSIPQFLPRPMLPHLSTKFPYSLPTTTLQKGSQKISLYSQLLRLNQQSPLKVNKNRRKRKSQNSKPRNP
jgi:hypothetical protein